MKRDFSSFMQQNRETVYAVAYNNCEHKENGRCCLPSNDSWMQDKQIDKIMDVLNEETQYAFA